jgi:hypothetical protein
MPPPDVPRERTGGRKRLARILQML